MTGELRQGTHSGGLQLRTNRERTIFTLSGHFHIFGSGSSKLACTKTGLILLKTDMKVNAGRGEHFSGALTYHHCSSSGYVTDVYSQYVFVGYSGTIYLGAYGDESGLVMHTVNNAYFSVK